MGDAVRSSSDSVNPDAEWREYDRLPSRLRTWLREDCPTDLSSGEVAENLRLIGGDVERLIGWLRERVVEVMTEDIAEQNKRGKPFLWPPVTLYSTRPIRRLSGASRSALTKTTLFR